MELRSKTRFSKKSTSTPWGIEVDEKNQKAGTEVLRLATKVRAYLH